MLDNNPRLVFQRCSHDARSASDAEVSASSPLAIGRANPFTRYEAFAVFFLLSLECMHWILLNRAQTSAYVHTV